jgi:hypothetical protein
MNQSLFKYFLENKNIAISGPGGVGKTYQINQIREYCEKNAINISVCASTGIAAKLIRGTTVHYWAGIKPYMVDKYIEGNLIYYASKKTKENEKRIKKTEVLVIDEVSMLGNHTFNLLDHICRVVRKTDKPFGGIRIIISFDMLQLPPVKEDYVFKSNVWKELDLSVIYLTKSFRTQDTVFFDILSRARIGKINEEDKEVLKKRINAVNKNFEEKNIKPTVLYSHKVDVDKLNHDNLKILDGPYYQYKSKDSVVTKEHGLITKDNINNLSSEEKKEAKEKFEYIDTIVPKEIYLKPKAQVLLTVNKDVEKGLVNGSRGIVLSCEKDGVLVKFEEDTVLIGYTDFTHEENSNIYIRSYIPLQLAWALTIHKCVSDDTLLSIDGKGLVKIKDLECKGQKPNTIYIPQNLEICGVAETKKIIEVYKGNIENGIKFVTSFGYEITTSERHPLLIFNKENLEFEWKKAPEISKEDYIIIKRGCNVEGDYFKFDNITFNNKYNKYINVPDKLNEDVSYFLGIMLGDGCINNKTYRFELVGIDFDILDKCIKILKEQFNIDVNRHKINDSNRKTPTDRIFFHCRQLVEIFSYFGYNFEKADKKQIPDCILRSPLSVQKEIIKGLYDTDGGVSPSCINFTTTSEIMGKQIQQMLLNMDILVSRVIMREENIEKNWKKVYRLNISGKSATVFTNTIGFNCKRKMDKAKERFYEKESERKNNKSQSFEIPNGHILIRKLRDEIEHKTKFIIQGKKIRNFINGIIRKYQKLRYDTISYIINNINNITQYESGKLLLFIHNNGILMDTIKNIEVVNNIQMYDIGVSPKNTSGFLPDGHDFIGNGFINHNCQGQSLDYAILDIGKSIFCPGQAYVALSRMKSLEGTILSSFDTRKFYACKEAIAFDEQLKQQVN